MSRSADQIKAANVLIGAVGLQLNDKEQANEDDYLASLTEEKVVV